MVYLVFSIIKLPTISGNALTLISIQLIISIRYNILKKKQLWTIHHIFVGYYNFKFTSKNRMGDMSTNYDDDDDDPQWNIRMINDHGCIWMRAR